MKLLITGATGMVGSEVMLRVIHDDEIKEVVVLTRKEPDIRHAKLKTMIHKDFMDYSSFRSLFTECDSCIWCLGVSQLQVSKDEYNIITYEYTMAAAKAMVTANPEIGFVFVSGAGADQSGKAKTLFGRVKGKAEKDLMELPFKKLVIARPAGIQPVRKNSRAPFLYKLFYFTYPLWKVLTPSKVITSEELARALVYLAKNKTEKVVFENKELKSIGT